MMVAFNNGYLSRYANAVCIVRLILKDVRVSVLGVCFAHVYFFAHRRTDVCYSDKGFAFTSRFVDLTRNFFHRNLCRAKVPVIDHMPTVSSLLYNLVDKRIAIMTILSTH